jgi:hypothetical protein
VNISKKIYDLYPVEYGPMSAIDLIDEMLDRSGGVITPEIEGHMKSLATLDRLQDLSNYHERLDADARAVEAVMQPLIEELQADLRAIERRKTRVKDLIQLILPPGPESAVCNEKVNLWYKETNAVEIMNPELIPIDFIEVRRQPDKRLIAEELKKEGGSVPGAQLKINYNLQVGHAGPRAAANQKAREKKRAEKTISESLPEPKEA